jgi:hypothetical protein
MRVLELKEILKIRGLNTHGTKQELAEREFESRSAKTPKEISAEISALELGLKYLNNENVISWLFGDLSFLEDELDLKIFPTKKSRETFMKKAEDEWGRTLTGKPQQWTNTFGEDICRDMCAIGDKWVAKPRKQNGLEPDLETEDEIFEVKTQTFFTSGTAGEKILGVPYKYSDIPELWGKPLKIFCVGYAEKMGRDPRFGYLENVSKSKKECLDFHRGKGITYVGATDVLTNLLSKLHQS